MLLSILLLGVSLNLDALCVGFTYGARKIHIPYASKMILFALSVFFSFIALFCGRWMLAIFPPFAAKITGALLLFSLGLYTVIKAVFSPEQGSCEPQHKEFGFSIKHIRITIKIMHNPTQCDMDASHSIEAKEALYLGSALSIDALAAGVAAALGGMVHIMIPFMIAVFQFLFLMAGRCIGICFKHRFSIGTKAVNIVSGLLLIAISLIRIVF